MAIVDVFLQHHVLKQHGALIFSIHSFAQEGVFLEAIDVLMEALTHRIEGVGKLYDLFGPSDLDRFPILTSSDGKGRIIEFLHGAGDLVRNDEEGGDHDEDGEAGGKDETNLEGEVNEIIPVVGKQGGNKRDVAEKGGEEKEEEAAADFHGCLQGRSWE